MWSYSNKITNKIILIYKNNRHHIPVICSGKPRGKIECGCLLYYLVAFKFNYLLLKKLVIKMDDVEVLHVVETEK